MVRKVFNLFSIVGQLKYSDVEDVEDANFSLEQDFVFFWKEQIDNCINYFYR